MGILRRLEARRASREFIRHRSVLDLERDAVAAIRLGRPGDADALFELAHRKRAHQAWGTCHAMGWLKTPHSLDT